MSVLGASNMNMNMNMNMAVGPDGTLTRVRFNTSDFRKLVTNPLAPPTITPTPANYPKNWDADLRSYVHLKDFVGNLTPTEPDWYGQVRSVITVPPSVPPAPEITAVLDKAADRDDRFAEIIHQHDAEGAISYFLGMFLIDPARHPNAFLLIRVARRIGELAVMCLKDDFRFPRPSQICPAIVPMIDPPNTPAFPAGHALQARLIARCLEMVVDPLNIPSLTAPPTVTPLRFLADRIAENRVVAGLHFPRDNQAGVAVADRIFTRLLLRNSFTTLVTAAQGDLHPS